MHFDSDDDDRSERRRSLLLLVVLLTVPVFGGIGVLALAIATALLG